MVNSGPRSIGACQLRLAPEHPFPAAVDDCLAAAEWVAANLESLGATSGKLAVGGDSAGEGDRSTTRTARLTRGLMCDLKTLPTCCPTRFFFRHARRKEEDSGVPLLYIPCYCWCSRAGQSWEALSQSCVINVLHSTRILMRRCQPGRGDSGLCTGSRRPQICPPAADLSCRRLIAGQWRVQV